MSKNYKVTSQLSTNLTENKNSSLKKNSNLLDLFINGDCLQELKKLPSKSVDLIFADPPYNLNLSQDLTRPDGSRVAGVDDIWDKFSNFAAYDDFSQQWISESKRILKDDGTIWLMGSYHNIFRLGKILQDNAFWILNDIVWVKNNPMPNFRGTRFTNAHETLIWASKNADSKYKYNYHAMKALNEDLQMRSDWHLPICSGGERLKDEQGVKIHSTQKPESLLYRVILSSSSKGDIVLDPFGGTGTTASVAKKLQRKTIYIEKDKKYFKNARERFLSVESLDDDSLEITSPKKEMRIPFGMLLESGYIKVGDKLTSPYTTKAAKVLADGSVRSGKQQGSIHKLGALMSGQNSVNGWNFWYVKNKTPLNELRVKLRETLIMNNSNVIKDKLQA